MYTEEDFLLGGLFVCAPCPLSGRSVCLSSENLDKILHSARSLQFWNQGLFFSSLFWGKGKGGLGRRAVGKCVFSPGDLHSKLRDRKGGKGLISIQRFVKKNKKK